MTKQSFLRGTLILVGAGFVTKVLGFVYRIVLSRIIGDEGMGLFQMAYPILLFAITLTTAGLPVAISKLVSEAEATGDERKDRNLLIVSTVIVTVTGLLFTALTILLAPVIANTLLTDERAVYPLLGLRRSFRSSPSPPSFEDIFREGSAWAPTPFPRSSNRSSAFSRC